MILSNVNIGSGPSAGDGDPLRSAFAKINDDFAVLANNIAQLSNSVTSVAGRQGNVVLTVNDVIGAASTGYVINALAQAALGNVSVGSLVNGGYTVQLESNGALTFSDGSQFDTSDTFGSWLHTGPIDEPTTKDLILSTGFETNYIVIPGTTYAANVGEGGTSSIAIGGKNGVTINAGSDARTNAQGNTWIFNVDGSLSVPGSIVPQANVAYSLGTVDNQWKDLFVSNNTIYIGGVPLTVDAGGTLLVNGNTVQGGGGTFTGTASNVEVTNTAIVYPTPFVGNAVVFTKTDYGNEVDEISANLHITRANNNGIYNPVQEISWDDSFGYPDGGRTSPKGTLWNIDGWGDLTNLSTRTYTTFYLISGNNNLGNWVPYQEWIMKDTINNKYYKFAFVHSSAGWGSQGRLSYTRTQIDGTTGATIGSPVVFVRLAGHPETVDVIDTGLTIARANNYPWYNSQQEAGYSFDDNNGYASPLGSEWNDDGWHNLHSVKERTYSKFYDINDWQIGYNVLGKKFVMHDIGDDKYYTVQFTSWTYGNNGGGFSYTRQLINTEHYFIKTAYGSEVDDIAPDVGITRGENGLIYNPYTEGGYDEHVSPEGTLWNVEGWDNLDDLTTRIYVPWWSAVGGYGARYKVPGKKYIMYVPSTDAYYAIDWIYWANGHDDPGGGFVYKRYAIDLTKINEGVKFADGTVQTTAYQPNVYSGEKTKVVSKAFGNWHILETSGSTEVSVTTKVYGTAATVTSQQTRNDSVIVTDWDTDVLALYLDNTKNIQFSLDGGTTYFDVHRSGYSNGYQLVFQTNDYHSVATTVGQTLYYRSVTGGEHVRWFSAEANEFRGAIIDFQAYSYYSGAAIIGTIHIVQNNGEYNITHTEVTSGNNDTSNIDIWFRDPYAEYESERDIFFRRLDGHHDTVRIQWTAKIFTGVENN